MAFLTSISGSGFGKRFELDKPKIVLGRHPDCDVTIEVGAVSRQHAQILVDGERFEIEDLKSRNGTFLNGQLLSERTLISDGDLIRICDVEYSFHGDEQLNAPVFDATGGADASSFGVIMVDDQASEGSSRAVQNKLDIRQSEHGSQLTTNAEARLQAVLEITRSLGRTLKLEDVLPKVLDTLFKVFLQADRAFVVLVENGDLVPRWIKTRQASQEESFRISRTVMNEVMESKQAIISLDATSDERFEMANSISDFRIRSMIVAPLLDAKGEPLGAIQMDTLQSKRHFDQADLEVLGAIATQAGVAIENAQLHESYVTQQRVEQDLELARNVQQAFLPNQSPGIEGYSFFDYYSPADQIGGDYFDYIELADGRLAVIVADVVGHGVAAAMLMAKLSAETRFQLARHPNPAEAITRLNSRIAALGVEKFVTLLCLVLDPQTGKLDIVNAGHMAPLWLRAGGGVEEPGVPQSGIPVGIMDDFEYELTQVQVDVGDTLVLYTDGINEAPSPEGQLFGIKQLQTLVHDGRGAIDEIGQQIIDEVKTFTKGTAQADDMCLVLLSRD